MKLYREEQLTTAYFMGNMDGFLNNKDYSISEHFEPIELPSDEEIEQEMNNEYPLTGHVGIDARNHLRKVGFIQCAKWMRDKIQGGKQ